MAKITYDDLDRIRQEITAVLNLRRGDVRARVLVHMGTCGIAAGSRGVMKAFMAEIEERKLEDVMLTAASCAGLCSREPMVTVEIRDQPPVKYVDMNAEKVPRLLEEHVMGGQIVTEYALSMGSERTLKGGPWDETDGLPDPCNDLYVHQLRLQRRTADQRQPSGRAPETGVGE